MSARYTLILDEKSNRMVPAGEYYAMREAERLASGGGREIPTIMMDIAPWQAVRSPVDNTMLTSRADVREHNRRNGVVDVGNDSSLHNPKRPEYKHKSAAPEIARLMRGEQPVIPAASLQRESDPL